MHEHGSPSEHVGRDRIPFAETLTALHATIARHARGEARDDELRRALRLMAREARAQQLRAEQLIIALKNLWRSLPEVQEAIDRTEQSVLLGRLVSICIQEYYAE